jgi:hypothetical protein
MEAKLVQATAEAQAKLQDKFSDKIKKNNYSEITDEAELKNIAENDLNIDYKEVKEKYDNSNIKSELSLGQFFSFLKTQQTAKENPEIVQSPEYKDFESNL